MRLIAPRTMRRVTTIDPIDTDDDVEKGRLKFNNKIYGREKELEVLRDVYDELAEVNKKGASASTTLTETSSPYEYSRVIFFGGYSGTGKSALVKEFMKRSLAKYQPSANDFPILHTSGKLQNKARRRLSVFGNR